MTARFVWNWALAEWGTINMPRGGPTTAIGISQKPPWVRFLGPEFWPFSLKPGRSFCPVKTRSLASAKSATVGHGHPDECLFIQGNAVYWIASIWDTVAESLSRCLVSYAGPGFIAVGDALVTKKDRLKPSPRIISWKNGESLQLARTLLERGQRLWIRPAHGGF